MDQVLKISNNQHHKTPLDLFVFKSSIDLTPHIEPERKRNTDTDYAIQLTSCPKQLNYFSGLQQTPVK